MPDPLTGCSIEADQALPVEIVPGSVTTVVVAGWRLHRQIKVTELRISRHRRPYPGIARKRRRALLPGIVTKLCRAGNGVEAPSKRPCCHIVSGDLGLYCLRRFRCTTECKRRANDDDVAHHDRWRTRANGRGSGVDLLIKV